MNTKRFVIYMEESLAHQIVGEAGKRGVKPSTWVRMLVIQELEKSK